MLAEGYDETDSTRLEHKQPLHDTALNKERRRPNSAASSACGFALAVLLVCLAVPLSIFSFTALEHKLQQPFSIPELPEQEPCEHATARPSWHSLPLHRRRGYRRAVDRLTTLPSRLGLNTSLYDDCKSSRKHVSVYRLMNGDLVLYYDGFSS